MATAVSDALALLITEQTGDKRTLTLTERALPYRPIQFGVKQMAEFTRYPGNPVRTLQIFGPEEKGTEIHGFWKDRFLGTQPSDSSNASMAYVLLNGQKTPLQTAEDLCNVVNDFARKGQIVVVQWGPRIRRGLLDSFDEIWHNVHDVEWTMRFEWQSQNDPQVPALLVKDTDYANALGSLLAKVQNLSDDILGVVNLASSQVQIYTNLIATVSGFVTEFSDTTSSAISTTMTIVDQQRRLAGILNDIATASVNAAVQVSLAPSITMALPDVAGGPLEGPELAVESVNRQLTSTFRDLQYLALGTQADILKSINPDIVAAFTARAATDLRDVSTSYYDTPDEWRSLMIFNNLIDSRLSAGQTVFVPNLTRPLDGSQ